jgi:hypothetical protein
MLECSLCYRTTSMTKAGSGGDVGAAAIFNDLAWGAYLASAHVYDTSLVDTVVAGNEYKGAENVSILLVTGNCTGREALQALVSADQSLPHGTHAAHIKQHLYATLRDPVSIITVLQTCDEHLSYPIRQISQTWLSHKRRRSATLVLKHHLKRSCNADHSESASH